ncbi:MAG: winged helix DNA-binding domain-containing protein [Ignavibacteria bacterium]|nr:winged helix DNA-binding domain-containing protein [Ignavibacteria bacterium]
MPFKPEIISLKNARYLALHNQFLLDTHVNNSKKDLLKIIENIGYVQIDTISIIERAHKHILWTRFAGYKNEMLDELIDKDKKVFEFWDHAASYVPMKHYRFTLPRKQMYERKYGHWGAKNKKLLKYIMDRITAEGPLQSKDFEDPSKRGAWWDWKPSKDGLEYLFHTGKLAVKARKNFQKVYDLPERVIPSGINDTIPTEEEYSAHLIMKAINANGFASEKEMTYLRYHNRSVTPEVINRLIEEKTIIPLIIAGLESELYYTTKKHLKQLDKKKTVSEIHILSPFDNLVIQRKRLKALFNFDYTIECYVPAAKRKFGYFCMPVLSGDNIVGRIDAKADRKENTLKIINIYYENEFKKNKVFDLELRKKLQELALFSGCSNVSG